MTDEPRRVSLSLEQQQLALEHVRRTWPVDYVLEVLELPTSEAVVVLELAGFLEAVPVDPVTLEPVAGEPLRRKAPARDRRRPHAAPPTGKPRPRPPELLGILRRLDIDPGELREGELEPLQLDVDGPAAA